MPGLTQAEIIAGLVYPNMAWTSPTITYSIPVAGSVWPSYPGSSSMEPPYYGAEPMQPEYGVLSAAQADAFRDAIAAWARLIAVPIMETNDLTATGEIRVAFTNTGNYGGYTNVPPIAGSPSEGFQGDIWLSSNYKDWTLRIGWNLAAGDNPDPILLHEIGHALGLKHPFDGGPTFPSEYDSIRYTVMTYNFSNFGEEVLSFGVFRDSNGADEFRTIGDRAVVDQPMVYDILAIQSIYGANPSTAAGDDIYRFTPGKAFFSSIYDAGGRDTIDLSDHARPCLVDLTPGAYSSVDIFTAEQQKAFWIARLPQYASQIAEQFDRSSHTLYTGQDNLGIAFGTVIENAEGGSGDDTLVGNAADNSLSGNAGDDSLSGSAGNDTLDGGAGANFLAGGDGDDIIQGGVSFDRTNGNAGNDTIYGNSGDDWVTGGKDNDVLYGQDGADVLNGNLGADTENGGEGSDTIRGGQGDDVLLGRNGDDYLTGDLGNDTLTGGAGADTFRAFAGGGHDVITDFRPSEGDRIVLDVGTTYTASQQGEDVLIAFNGSGDLVLRKVTLSSLGVGWIVGG